VPYGGGSGSAGLLTASACAWTAASSDPSWLSVNNPSGSGGADIGFAALTNASANPKSATITVSGATGSVVYTITQPGAPCTVTLSAPGSAGSFSSGTGSGSFTFNTSVGGCPAPVVQSFAGWLTASSSFAGTAGTVNFSLAANSAGLARTGVIQVNDQIYTVKQSGAACSYNLNSLGAAFGTAGGPGSFLGGQNVIGCTPTVTANPEITLVSRTQAGSIFTQNYTVGVYSSLTSWVRKLYIDFGGQLFTVKQTSW
jgi:hypothetical protein